MGKYNKYLLFIISITMFIVGITTSNTDLILASICGVLLNNILYCMRDFNEKIIFLLFNVSFFTFLVGRMIVKRFSGYHDIYNNNMYGLDFNDKGIMIHILMSVFMSITFVFIGYYIATNKLNKHEKSIIKTKRFDEKDLKIISMVSRYIFYVATIFNLLVLVDKIKFTNTAGYMALYSSYKPSLPGFMIKISEMSTIALFVFLGTLPEKKQALVPLGLYMISGILSLVVGQRNNFVLNIMIIIVYFIFRNTTDKQKPWFGKKEIITSICILPIVIFLLNAVSYIRDDENVKNTSIVGTINEFIYKQGASVNLIGYAEKLKDNLPKGKNYTFGRTIDFINENAVTQLFFDAPTYKSQTVESALYGNSFADSVSYLISPERYKNGWGYGSSYVAELYTDFSYIGIVIGSIIIGAILASMRILLKMGPILVGLGLSMTRLLLYSPRDTTTSFIVSSFSLINILTIVIILLSFIIVKYKKNIIKRARVLNT